jgi:glycosyltransferase involved in cell wall biosynthesis
MEVNLWGPVCQTGYGVHTVNFASQLHKLDETDVNLLLIGNRDYNGKWSQVVDQMIERGFDKVDRHAPSIRLWHEHDMASFHGSYRIGYTVFEMDRLSERAKWHLGQLDEIWVVSKWAQRIVQSNLMDGTPIFVIPEGVDNEVFEWAANPIPHHNMRIASIGKFEKRKGHYTLLEALRTSTMKVDLIAHWFNPFLNAEGIAKSIAENGWTPKGRVRIAEDLDHEFLHFECENQVTNLYLSLHHLPDQKLVHHIYNLCDIGVFASFAEGWNLPLIEAMSSGLPCIATNYSGHTEYLTEENCMPINDFNHVLAKDNIWFNKQGKWAEVAVATLQRLIWDALNDNSKLLDLRGRLRDFGEKWSWKNAALKARERLSSIY